ncbi:U1 small nuclear ribonucleoprotein C [Dipsacomyces acuminosporus]|nr:U1 small nuclear ribonucleoprotein C [Dipsacomyces acuminosporus]
MPKYYCDYCDIFLTHDSASVRKAHNTGWKHINQVASYYRELDRDKTQEIIDKITNAYDGQIPPIILENSYQPPPPSHYHSQQQQQHHYQSRRSVNGNGSRGYSSGRQGGGGGGGGSRNPSRSFRPYSNAANGPPSHYAGHQHGGSSIGPMPPPPSSMRYPPPPPHMRYPPHLPPPGPALSAPPQLHQDRDSRE